MQFTCFLKQSTYTLQLLLGATLETKYLQYDLLQSTSGHSVFHQK